ncbi:MAG: TonB-dependent receptor [Saprospiraceae bacterium]|nr:TonB-dependent receptor [Saprospiraceae bacterium]
MKRISWAKSTLLIFLFSRAILILPAQETSLSDPGPKIPLSSLLGMFESQHGFHFAYDVSLIDSAWIDRPSQSLTSDEALAFLAKHTPYQIKKMPNDHVMIIPGLTSPAPDLILQGRIVDEKSGEPLPYASVLISGTLSGTQTDERGFFELTLKKPDRQEIEIHYLGYQKQTIPYQDLTGNKKVRIKLRTDEVELEDVIIEDVAVMPIDFQDSKGYYNLNPDQINLQAGWGEPDILRMIQMLPGIQSANETAAGLNIRGGTPDQNLVLIDGIPIYKSGHFFGMFSSINPYTVDQVEIHKGGVSTPYGGRVSGVIDIKNGHDTLDRLKTGAGINLVNWHAYIEAPLFKKRSNLLFSIRRSLTESIKSSTYSNIFNQLFQDGKIAEYQDIERQDLLNKNSNTFSYSDVNFKWNYRFKKDDEISISFFSGKDAFLYDFEVDLPQVTHATTDDVKTENTGFNFTASNRWFNWWQTRISFISSEYTNDYLGLATADLNDSFHVKLTERNTMTNGGVFLDQIFTISENQTLTTGLQYNSWDVEYDLNLEQIWTDSEPLFVELSNKVGTFYINYLLEYRNRLFIDAGIRLNRLNELENDIWEPRLSVKWRPEGSHFMFKSSIGSYKQFVSQIIVDEIPLTLGINRDIWVTTELNLIPPLRSKDFVIGLNYQNKGFLLDLEAYTKQTEGLSFLNLDIPNPNDNVFSPGASDARGIELLLQNKWNKYRSILAYNLSKVDYHFEDLNFGNSFPASHDQRHALQWTHMYTVKNWDFILGFNIFSGKPYTVPNRIVPRQNSETGEIYHLLDVRERNQERLSTYHRMDLSIQYKYVTQRFRAQLGFSLFNIYNQPNELDRKYFIARSDNIPTIPRLGNFTELSLQRTPNFYLRFEL